MPARALSELPESSWPKNPHYVMDLDLLPFRVRAVVNGETVVDSTRCRVMFELGHAPIYYVPRAWVSLTAVKISSVVRLSVPEFCNSWASTFSNTSESDSVLIWRKSD